jgi:hypothetical protein
MTNTRYDTTLSLANVHRMIGLTVILHGQRNILKMKNRGRRETVVNNLCEFCELLSIYRLQQLGLYQVLRCRRFGAAEARTRQLVSSK